MGQEERITRCVLYCKYETHKFIIIQYIHSIQTYLAPLIERKKLVPVFLR